MKITICGSMHFAQDMLNLQNKLNELGHEVIVPQFTKECVKNPYINVDYEILTENDCMMWHFNRISESDAILVINKERKGFDGYIGGSALMEIGLAKYLGKKIFILNELPDEKNLSYILEVKLTQPIILNGDINKISEHL